MVAARTVLSRSFTHRVPTGIPAPRPSLPGEMERALADARAATASLVLPDVAMRHEFRPERIQPALRRLHPVDLAAALRQEVTL